MAIDIGEILIRLRADTGKAGRDFGDFAKRTDARLVSLTKNLDAFSRRLTGLRAIATAALGPAILKIGSDFDKAITNVRAITKETETQFESTRKQAIAVADEYGRSATEVGGALFQIVSAGLRGEQAFTALRAATATAKAGLVDTALATDVLVGTLNAFGKSGNEAAEVAGKLIGVVDRGILTFEDLATKLGNVSPVAAAAGVELEELLGILALLTRNGVRFAQATTQTRGAIVKLIAPGREARKAIEELLGTTIEASIAQRGYIDTLEAVVKASDGTVASFKRLFEDVEAVQGVTAIASQGFNTLREDIEALRNAGNATLVKTTEIQANSLAQLTVAIRSLVQNQVIRFFEEYRDAIIGAATGIRDFLRDNERLVALVVRVTGLVATFAAAGIALGIAIKGVVFILNAYRTALGALGIIKLKDAALNKANTASQLENTAAVATNTAARGGQATAIIGTEVALATNTALLRTNTAAYVLNTKAGTATAAAQATTAAATTKFGLAMNKLGRATGVAVSILGNNVGTFARYGTILARLGVAGAAAAVAFGSFKLGQGIRRALDGELRATEELVERLEEVDELISNISQQNATRLAGERAERQIEVLDNVDELQKKLKEARDLARQGDTAAADEITRIEDRLKKLAPTAAQAQEQIGSTFEQLASQISGALDQLGDETGTAIGGTDPLSAAFGNPDDAIATAALIRAGIAQSSVEARELLERFQQVRQAYRDIGEQIQQDTARSAANENARAALNAGLNASAELLGEVRTKSRELVEETSRGLTSQAVNEFADLNAQFNNIVDDGDRVRNQINNIRAVLARNQQSQFLDKEEFVEAVSTLTELETVIKDIDQAAANVGAQIGNIATAAIEAAAKSRQIIFETTDDLEIELLRKQGKRQQAADRLADKRARERIKQAAEAYNAEREQINDLIEQRRILIEQDAEGNAEEIAQIENAITMRQENLRGIEDKLDLIEEINREEKRGNAEAAREEATRIEDARQKREQAALEEQANAERLLLLEAIRENNLTDEIAARERLIDIETELAALRKGTLENELATINNARERIELLKQELQDAANAGKTDAFEGLTRDALRDITGGSGGATDRGAIRDKLSDINSQEGLDATEDATAAARDTLFNDLNRQRNDAIEAGDTEEVERLNQEIRELIEFWRIFQDEVRRRSEEIKEVEEERQRIEAENAQNAVPAGTPGDPAGPPAPGVDVQPPTTDVQPPATGQPSQAPAQPETPEKPATPAQQQDQDPTTAVSDAASNAQSALAQATARLNTVVNITITAINNMAAETVSGFESVSGKLEELTEATNSNTGELVENRRRIEDLRITKRNG